MANAVRSVGYIKGAMLFHELKNRIGEKHFEQGISLFFKRYQDKKAGWEDIQEIFEETSLLALDSFFTERLTRKDIPELGVEDIHVDFTAGNISLSFTLSQKTSTPYSLFVPIEVETGSGPIKFVEEVSTAQKKIELQLDSTPLQLTIDPYYDLFRSLDEEETVPTWSQILGASSKTVIVAAQDRELFAPLLQLFSGQNGRITDVNDVQNSDLEEENLVFLGTDNTISRSLFGSPSHPETGLTLDVRPHPLNPDKAAVLVSCSNSVELKKAFRRLPHYGKYSYLHFENGRMEVKKVLAGNMGMQYSIEQPPMAFASSALVAFTDLTSTLTDTRAIYIGETHTSMSDHHLQYRLIEELFRQNPELAIGMEMFPRSSQKALDDFILGNGTMSEKAFLKQSKYFQVWKYDYRYYREIINFAKKNSIPVVGLNIDRNIVSSVFRSGSTDSLTEEERSSLPVDRDLDMPGYRRRLSTIHGFHMQGEHGKRSLGGFIQAQGLWDEAMAETIADYLKKNPKKRMIILAGAQHTRKDSGIPPRVERRLSIKQYSILNANSFTEPSSAIADYYFFTTERTLLPAGKIGVTLEEKNKDGDIFLQISKLSPHSKAEESGIRENDTLLSINGYTVKDMEDVHIAMIDARPKEKVLLQLKRIDNSLQTQLLTVTVELYEPLQN